ncbi:MAG TPA: hypothetical protein VMR33_22705 [Candidatus Baltobacteraceae bacterium]|jgi:type IV secretory pathway protease TraF|nr:hypothetical protein [Candidatus Baltobacteraceae bacterium]
MNREDFEIWASTVKLIAMATEGQLSAAVTLSARIGLVEKHLSLLHQINSLPDGDHKRDIREQLSKTADQVAALSHDKTLGDTLARLQSAHDQLLALIEHIRASFDASRPPGAQSSDFLRFPL